jgi:hypothetical protein
MGDSSQSVTSLKPINNFVRRKKKTENSSSENQCHPSSGSREQRESALLLSQNRPKIESHIDKVEEVAGQWQQNSVFGRMAFSP